VSQCQKRTSGLYDARGDLTEADTPTIRLGASPFGLTSAHLHHPPVFLQARCPSCHPTNSVKALKATSTFVLGRRDARVLLNGVTCTVSVPQTRLRCCKMFETETMPKYSYQDSL